MVLKYCYELQDADILLFMASTFISKRLSDSFKKKKGKKESTTGLVWVITLKC